MRSLLATPLEESESWPPPEVAKSDMGSEELVMWATRAVKAVDWLDRAASNGSVETAAMSFSSSSGRPPGWSPSLPGGFVFGGGPTNIAAALELWFNAPRPEERLGNRAAKGPPTCWPGGAIGTASEDAATFAISFCCSCNDCTCAERAANCSTRLAFVTLRGAGFFGVGLDGSSRAL